MRSFIQRSCFLVFILFSFFTVNAGILSIHISTNDPKCFGGTDGYVTIDSLSTIAPTGPYSIKINTSPVQSFKVGDTIQLGNGGYTITVIDSSDINYTKIPRSFRITEPFQLGSNVISSKTTCFGDCDGSATIFAYDGTAPYSYLWSDPLSQTKTTASSLCAGMYYVTITDDHGCTAIDSVNVIEPAIIMPKAKVTDVDCYGNATGSATIIPTGGSGTYVKYTWSSSANTTKTEKNLSAGTYYVTVEDDNGCLGVDTFRVTQPAAPLSTTLSKKDVDCYGDSTGSISNSPAGGTAPYTYLWNDAASTRNRSNLKAGTYTVTVTDSNNCTVIDNITINQNTKIALTFTVTDVFCNGDATGSISVSASGGTQPYASYQWSNSASGNTNNNLTAGTYVVTVTDALGCKSIDTAKVKEPTALIATKTASNDPTCFQGTDGSIDISVSGGTTPYTYAWSDGPITTQDRSGLSKGYYTVTVTDKNNCTAIVMDTIKDPPPLYPNVKTTAVLCKGDSNGTATASPLNGTGAYTYIWSSSSNTTNKETGLKAGTYKITVTDDTTGCQGFANVTITQPAQAVKASIFQKSDVGCFGKKTGFAIAQGSGGTSASGNYSYKWDDPNNQTTKRANNLAAGTYHVTVTDDNGCTDTVTVIINQRPDIVIGLTPTNISCNGGNTGSIALSISGGTQRYNWVWSHGPFGQGASNTQNGLTVGKYYVTVTDGLGCTAIDSITLTQPTALKASIDSVKNPSCFGANDGTIDISVSGGTVPYTYNWSDGPITSQDRSGLNSGVYSVTITDKNNCTKILTDTLIDPAQLFATIDSIKHVSCNGLSDGFARVAASGGVAPYTYKWSNAVSTKGNNNLAAGSYIVTITDANNCTVTDTAIVTEPAVLSVTINSGNTQCSGTNNGTATAVPSGGTSPYTYKWSNSKTTNTINNLSAGLYYVTVTDDHNCTVVDSVNITQPTPITLSFTTVDVKCNGDSSGSATVIAKGGNKPYTYLWNDPSSQTAATASNLTAGKYIVTVTDNGNCTKIDTVTINEPDTLKPNLTISDATCNGINDGSVSASPSGGTSPYSYAWSVAGTGSSLSNLGTGSYQLTLTDGNGCDTIQSFIISRGKIDMTFQDSIINNKCFGDCNGKISILNLSGKDSPFTYTWSNSAGDTNAVSGLCAGTYKLTISNSIGCDSVMSFIITEPNKLTASFSNKEESCSPGTDGSSKVTVSGGTQPYSYNWSNSAKVDSIFGLTAGKYYLTITDGNGCLLEDSTEIIANTTSTITYTDSVKNNNCFGDCNGAISVYNVGGGIAPYTFTWSNSAGNTSNVNGLCSGNYKLTISDSVGCDTVISFIITSPNQLIARFDTTQESCSPGNDGTAKVTVSGGVGPYTYNWSNGFSLDSNHSLTAGKYYITITDKNGCTLVDSTLIESPAVFTVTPNHKDVKCNGDSSGSINLILGGVIKDLVFSWNKGLPATKKQNNLAAGTYFVTIMDTVFNCQKMHTIIISEPNAISVNYIKTTESCNVGHDGTAKAVVSGGIPPYTYSWSTSAVSDSIFGLSAGKYYLTITDSNSCSSIDSVQILPATPIMPNLQSKDESCNASCDGAIQFNPSGGSSTNYTYLWTPVPPNGQGVSSSNNLCAGSYKIKISTGNCDTTVKIIIGSFPAIQATVTEINGQSCGGSTAACDGEAYVTTKGGTPPYTYSWANGTTVGANQDTLTNACAGTYQLTITDAKGCITTAKYTISKPTEIKATFKIVNSGCNVCNGSIIVNPSGGTAPYTYQWYNQSFVPINVNDKVDSLCAGIYFIDITDSLGCIERFNAIINDSTAEALTVKGTNTNCSGSCDGEAIVSFNCTVPTCTIAWLDSAAKPLNINTNTASQLCSGDYFVQVTNGSGCISTERITIDKPNGFIVLDTLSNPSCVSICDGAININVLGGSGTYSYNWVPGPAVGQGSPSVSNLCPGTYSVTITDSLGCDTTLNYTIISPSPMTATFIKTEANCGAADGSITATVQGGTAALDYKYQWFDGNNNLLSGEEFATINNIAAGIYNLRVTDDNGCLEYFITVLGNINGPLIQLDSIQDVSCFSNNDGAIDVTVSGGITPYVYNWLPNGQVTEDLSGIAAGMYTFMVTDSVKCISTQVFEVKQDSELVADIKTINAQCGLCDGKATIIMSGGNSPYTYLWSNGSTADSTDSLCAGVYTVKVTDSTGCTETFNFSISNQNAPTARVAATASTCVSSCDGTIKVTASGGIPPYSYIWLHNNLDTNYLDNLCPGKYTVQVTDAKGCSDIEEVIIGNPTQLIVKERSTPTICGVSSCDGSIYLATTGGHPPYYYNWGSISSLDTNYVDSLCAGTYSVTISDSYGCDVIKKVNISNNGNPITANPTVMDESCFGSCDGSLLSNITLSPSVSFQWLNVAGSAIAPKDSNLIGAACAGEYSLQVTSLPEGCITLYKVKVSSPDSIDLAGSLIKPISCAGSCDGEVFISTTGGSLLIGYVWDDGNQQTTNPAVGLCAGNYTVTATDANGCLATVKVNLKEPDSLHINILSSTEVDCSSDCYGTATVNASGGTAPYDFSWSGGETGDSVTTLCFGPNIVTLTDATGCSITDTVFISAVDTVITKATPITLICEGDSVHLDGTVIGKNLTSKGWYNGDTTLLTTSEDTTLLLPVGDYTFFLIATKGACTDTTILQFSVVKTPKITLAPNMKLYRDQVKQILIGGKDNSYQYSWTPDSNLTKAIDAEPFTDTRKTRVYTIVVLDTNGCMATDSILVLYYPEIKVPSGFTPNGDGVNDVWVLDALDDFPNADVSIYNRWGELLYQQKNGYKEPWDGQFKGSAMPVGTYYYIIDLKSEKYKNITGPLTIIK